MSTSIEKSDALQQAQQPIQTNQSPKGFWMTYLNVWKKCFNFSTRTNRTEYFLFILFNSCVLTCLTFVIHKMQMNAVFQNMDLAQTQQKPVLLTGLICFQLVLGLIALFSKWVVVAQRLRDTNRSGLVVLFMGIGFLLSDIFFYFNLKIVSFALSIIPFCLAGYVYIVAFFKGTDDKNKYGAVPFTTKKYVGYLAGALALLNVVIFMADDVNRYELVYRFVGLLDSMYR